MVSTAGILIIGDEILSGRTKDTNSNWLAKELNLLGIRLEEITVIPDNKSRIIDLVKSFSKKFTYVFTCGGIGPTHDDITTESIAEAFNLKLEKNKEAMKVLQIHYKNSNIEFNEARQKMAIIPIGAKLIDNPVSAAPGFIVENVYVFAGVPQIMHSMFGGVSNQLIGGKYIFSKTITCNLGEGKIAKSLKYIEDKYKNLKIGSYPYFRPESFGTSIVLRCEKEEIIDKASEELIRSIEENGGKGNILLS